MSLPVLISLRNGEIFDGLYESKSYGVTANNKIIIAREHREKQRSLSPFYSNTIIQLKSLILIESFEACKSRAEARLGFKRRLIRKLRRRGGY